MDTQVLIDSLIQWVAFIALVVVHEYAHAWTAVRCGDDTPRQQGRLTLDPIAHIDLIGTIVLPLLITLLSALGGQPMMFGWGRPVQVNLNNFRHRQRDDILVSGAGPAMNLIVAIGILGIMKIVELAGGSAYVDVGLNVARLSLFLCFFNLLPIPPLDGGHIVRNLVGISDEVYHAISQYSFMFFLLIMRVPAIGQFVNVVADGVLMLIAYPLGWRLTTVWNQ